MLANLERELVTLERWLVALSHMALNHPWLAGLEVGRSGDGEGLAALDKRDRKDIYREAEERRNRAERRDRKRRGRKVKRYLGHEYDEETGRLGRRERGTAPWECPR